MVNKIKPDGGWGWWIVIWAAFINVFNQSLLSLFGLIFGPKLETIAGTTGLTTVMSVSCTISNFSGFLISPLSNFLSQRQVTQLGVFLVSFGMMVSSYTRSYDQVMLGYGIITGMGLGLIASSTFLIVNSYFDNYKSMAVGLAMAGTSIGQMLMPQVAASLITIYGHEGTILLLAGFSLHGLVAAMSFQPVTMHLIPKTARLNESFWSWAARKICCQRNNKKGEAKVTTYENNPENNVNNSEHHDESSSLTTESCSTQETAFISNVERDAKDNNNISQDPELRSLTRHSFETMSDKEIEEYDSESITKPPSRTTVVCNFLKQLLNLIDLELLTDPTFLHILVGMSFVYTTSISFSAFFPLFLSKDLDLPLFETSTCMTVLSLFDFIGRLCIPVISKRFNMSHRTTFIFATLILAVFRGLLVEQTTFGMLLLFSGLTGLSRAATVINQNLVIAEYVKDEKISSAVGLNMVSRGVFVLSIGRWLGMYKDSAHKYSGCIQILNVIAVVVIVSWSLEIVAKKIFCRRR